MAGYVMPQVGLYLEKIPVDYASNEVGEEAVMQ